MAARRQAEGGGTDEGGEVEAAGQTMRGRYPRMPVSKFGDRITTAKSFADRMMALGEADDIRYTPAMCRIFEGYIAALLRRRKRMRAAIKRKQQLEEGRLDEDDEDEDEDVRDDPDDMVQLLRPADAHNNDKAARIRALWEPNGDYDATNFVSKLTPQQLEEVLVDVLLVGELFKFGHERAKLKLPSQLKDEEAGNGAIKKEQQVVEQGPRLVHGEVFEREHLEDLIAKLLYERHQATILLQTSFKRLSSIRIRRELLAEFKAQDASAMLLQSSVRRLTQGTAGRQELVKLRREARQIAMGADLQCLDLISLACDGDAVWIPKGRHYPRITQLASFMPPTQNFMHVKDASQVRERGVGWGVEGGRDLRLFVC